jgi:hypothetical protein
MKDLLDTCMANPTIRQSTATMQTTGKNIVIPVIPTQWRENATLVFASIASFSS